MGYIAKERIYLDDAGQPCEPDDPRVAQQVAVPGGTLSDKLVERYGLAADKRLLQLPGAAGPERERGTDYYELTGTEKPVTKAERHALGQEQPASAPPAPEPPPAEPAPAASEKPAPAKAAK